MAITTDNKKDLFTPIGLNSVYRTYFKAMDRGITDQNRPDEILTREGMAEAERCFRDPQVSTCFNLLAFSLMKKRIEFQPIKEGLKRNINKSKKMAEFLNFSLQKLQEGGTRQLIYNLFTAKFFSWSLLEKVFAVLTPDQSSKWNGYYYYQCCLPKRIGLWDFVYDDFGRVKGYQSLVDRTKVFDKDQFLRISYLPLHGNPNGIGDFSKVHKFWYAKVNFMIFLLDLGGRLSKGRQAVLKNTGVNGSASDTEKDEILETLAENLNLYLPQGYDIDFHSFDVGALQYFLQVLRWLDSQIAIAMLGSSLAVNESQGAGTNAQSQVHQTNVFTFEEYIQALICEELDESYRNSLLKLNFNNIEYPEEIYPNATLIIDEKESKEVKAKIYQMLKDLGVIDTDTYTDLNMIRQDFDLPDNPELFDQVENNIKQSLEDAQNLVNDPSNDSNEDFQDLNNTNVGVMYK